jgi:LuxR family quorum-sensing system transcriptional regulator SolR
MLHTASAIDPGIRGETLLPDFLQPLARANEARQSTVHALTATVRSMGFEGFTYATLSVPTTSRDTRLYAWTDLPAEWTREYDEQAYVEVDPRVTEAIGSARLTPWDRLSFPDSPRRRALFDAAARYGVCSGVAVRLLEPTRLWSGFFLSSSWPRLNQAALVRYAALQGDILLLAHYVHATLTPILRDADRSPPLASPVPSRRELQCLQLAAKGLSSGQIAAALEIDERVVQFHIGSLLSKLASTNRHQAIAKAVSAGLIDP